MDPAADQRFGAVEDEAAAVIGHPAHLIDIAQPIAEPRREPLGIAEIGHRQHAQSPMPRVGFGRNIVQGWIVIRRPQARGAGRRGAPLAHRAQIARHAHAGGPAAVDRRLDLAGIVLAGIFHGGR